MLGTDKNGFETYIFKDKIYLPIKSVSEIPLFIAVTEASDRNQAMELLKKLVKNCGGRKLSL